MSIEFDQTTIANMTAALEQVCNRFPPESDTHKNRKRIADAMIAYARSGGVHLKRLPKPRVQDLGGDHAAERSRLVLSQATVSALMGPAKPRSAGRPRVRRAPGDRAPRRFRPTRSAT